MKFPGINLQKHHGLVLGSSSQAGEGSMGQLLGTAHSAPFFGDIVALGGRGVGVQRDQGVGGQPGGGQRNVESAGQVGGDVCIGLEVDREGGQRGLRANAASSEHVGSHAGAETREKARDSGEIGSDRDSRFE